jgi:hypothetical protein
LPWPFATVCSTSSMAGVMANGCMPVDSVAGEKKPLRWGPHMEASSSAVLLVSSTPAVTEGTSLVAPKLTVGVAGCLTV